MPKKSAYVAWYRTVQVCVQVPCTFAQVPCTFVHVQRFCVAHFCARVVRCTWVWRNLSISYCVHPSCTKMCNAEPLHIFVQLGCTIVQVSLAHIWYRLHTQLVTGTFVMPARTTTHVVATHITQKKATTHSHYSATRPWPMPPPSSLGDKTIKICYKDDVDCREGRASSSRRRRHPG
jgi:hypothetical protein